MKGYFKLRLKARYWQNILSWGYWSEYQPNEETAFALLLESGDYLLLELGDKLLLED